MLYPSLAQISSEPLEGQVANQKIVALLVMLDLPQGKNPGPWIQSHRHEVLLYLHNDAIH